MLENFFKSYLTIWCRALPAKLDFSIKICLNRAIGLFGWRSSDCSLKCNINRKR